MIVKVCGITRREDAEVAVEAGASAIGFIFYKPSPRYVTPERARELGQGLAIWKVGVFVEESRADIESIMRAAKLDVAQVYGNEIPRAVRSWHAVRMNGLKPVPLVTPGSEALFLDSSGNGLSFDWALARGAAEKVIIAGGLDGSSVGEAIRVAQPWGVDASSGLESAPGIKDHAKIRRFIDAARKAS